MLQLTKHQTGILIAIMAAVTFGLYPATLRAVYADGGNAAFVIIATTWARALSMGLYCIFKGSPLFRNHKETRQSIIGGIFQAISLFSILIALVYVPGPLVIIIVFTHTLMLLFYMAWRGEIKLDRTSLITAITALLGLTLVLDIWHPQTNTHWIGMGLAFMAALATVSRLYVYGHETKLRNPIAVGADNYAGPVN
jgi:hypothetical protein